MIATAYDTMYETWLTTGKMAPMPTKAELEKNSALLWHWMELTWDIACIEAFRELREERKRKTGETRSGRPPGREKGGNNENH